MFTKENARAYGMKGGRNNLRKHGPEQLARAGRKGGQKLFEVYGREHMSKIGSVSGYSRKPKTKEANER